MNSHDLAKMLMHLPNLPIATHANNHTYNSWGDANSHGALQIGIMTNEYNQVPKSFIIIGNFPEKKNIKIIEPVKIN